MQRGNPGYSLTVVALLLLIPATTFAQADCSKEIAEIEARLSTGDYPARNVQIARQAQVALMKMCAFMTDDAKADMMEKMDELLPVDTAGGQPTQRAVPV
ncbi:MAG: hypothetical protein WB812_14815, partial [Woeseiaceae bacterium]